MSGKAKADRVVRRPCCGAAVAVERLFAGQVLLSHRRSCSGPRPVHP